MKKFLLGTVLVLVFGTRCFAVEDPVPGGFYGSGPHTDGTNWTSHLTKSEYPPGGYTYPDGKRCHWVVVVEKTRPDGSDAGDDFYDTGKPCDEPPPSIAGVPPPPIEYVNGPAIGDPNFIYCPPREDWIKHYVISLLPLEEAFYYADGTVIVCRELKLLVALPPAIKLPSAEAKSLKQALEENPDASDDLLKGNPASDGDNPALSDPKAAKQLPKTEDRESENSQSEVPNKSSETDQKSQARERQSESKPNGNSENSDTKSGGNSEKSNSKSTGNSEEPDAKTPGNSEHSDAKSARTFEHVNERSEAISKHAKRAVAHEKSQVSHHVGHMTEAAHLSGMHEAEKHMGSIGAMHGGGGFGGLGRMGGMHLGGFGGMHLGGFGRL